VSTHFVARHHTVLYEYNTRLSGAGPHGALGLPVFSVGLTLHLSLSLFRILLHWTPEIRCAYCSLNPIPIPCSSQGITMPRWWVLQCHATVPQP
jgi:hypothetical protein